MLTERLQKRKVRTGDLQDDQSLQNIKNLDQVVKRSTLYILETPS